MAATAVILDLDGTIWDSRPWLAQLISGRSKTGQRRALAQLEQTPAATLLGHAGITHARYRDLCAGSNALRLYPGVIATLRQLAGREIPLAAVTNLPRWMASPMLDCKHLTPLLVTVVDYGRTRRRKPYPDPILAALDDLQLSPDKRVWYVGDTVDDCRAACAAGVSFAWASYGYGTQPPDGTSVVLRRFSESLTL